MDGRIIPGLDPGAGHVEMGGAPTHPSSCPDSIRGIHGRGGENRARSPRRNSEPDSSATGPGMMVN